MADLDPIVILTFGLYAAGILNSFRILGDRQSPPATIAWILINVGIPWLGLPAYYLMGKSRLRGYLKRRKASSLKFTPYAEQLQKAYRDEEKGDYGVDKSIRPHFDLFKKIFSRFGPVFEPHPNTVQLLVDGKATFDEIFAAIESATDYILVQYYILKSDRLGIELKNLLVRQARKGIPVYLLYDDMGSFWLSRDYIRDLKKAGVQMARFLPVMNLRRFQLNFRNHRKLVVVDGFCAFTGGLNVGDEYVGRNVYRHWRDTHVKVIGPAVKQLEEIFLDDWFFAARRKIKLKPPETLLHTKHPPPLREGEEPPSSQGAFVQPIPSGPTDEYLVGVLLFMSLINAAKKRLWIATPYFIPDSPLQRAMELAALRGVDIRLILPEKSEYRIVHWVSMSYASDLLEKGIKVYLYTKGFMHQKVILVDDGLSAIGTTNFDNRAMYLNFESTLIIHQREFGQHVEDMLTQDLARSRALTSRKRRFGRKLRGDAARLLAPLL